MLGRVVTNLLPHGQRVWRRCIVACSNEPIGGGLVLGVYSEGEASGFKHAEFTKTAEKFNKAIDGKLEDLLRVTGRIPVLGEVRMFYGLVEEFAAIAVVGLGSECVGFNEDENMDECKEAVRIAASAGCQALSNLNFRKLAVESFGHAESAAEGASLGLWLYQDLKNESRQKPLPRLELFDDCSYTAWQIGLEKAAAQNLARQLSETPANILTPSAFAQRSVEILCKAGVNVDVKVGKWAKMMGMDAFLATARGSCQDPIFLEISYYGCEKEVAPVVLVGKGVTFDSGGLCLNSCGSIKEMRGDMSSAASVVATCRAISKLQLPINVKALLPLCENMPGARAVKPGDVVTAMNGKTVVIQGMDIDGRLCIADALVYAEKLNPRFILDLATLSKDSVEIIGDIASFVFSNNDSLYDLLRIASIHTGDRIWRLPLWDHFSAHVKADKRVDLSSDGHPMCPCSIAAFLWQFIPQHTDWIHIDTYNVNISDGIPTYLSMGMSGRPTRTLIEFLAQLGCAQIEPDGSSDCK